MFSLFKWKKPKEIDENLRLPIREQILLGNSRLDALLNVAQQLSIDNFEELQDKYEETSSGVLKCRQQSQKQPTKEHQHLAKAINHEYQRANRGIKARMCHVSINRALF